MYHRRGYLADLPKDGTWSIVSDTLLVFALVPLWLVGFVFPPATRLFKKLTSEEGKQ